MVGNIPNYAPLDVLRCFLKLGREVKSRQTLAGELEFGEGTVKTLLGILKEKSLTVSNKQGHRHSRKGMALLNSIIREVSLPRQITYKDFFSQLKKSAVTTKISRDVSASRVRDAAIRAGAEAAFILHFVNGSLKMSEHDKYTFTEIEKQFQLKSNDIILVSFADTHRQAELGVLAQALYVRPRLISIAVNSFDLDLSV